MKYRYTKFTGDDLDEIDLEDLLSKLSDLLLGSGFDNPYGVYDDEQSGHSMQSLHDAIMEAILNGGMLSDETLERLLGKDWRDADDAEQRLDQLIEKIIEKLQAQGYLSGQPDLEQERERRQGTGAGMGNPEQYRFEITDKSLDFLGYKALRDLLGSLGKSSLGRHDTREMATGIEASGASKKYEFGDTLNLDASGTILNAVLRTRKETKEAKETKERCHRGRGQRRSRCRWRFCWRRPDTQFLSGSTFRSSASSISRDRSRRGRSTRSGTRIRACA